MLGVCVSLLFLSYTCIEEGGPFFLAGLAGIAAAFLFLLIALLVMALKKSAYADSGKFFLVKPYAVKAVYGVLHGFDGARGDSQRGIEPGRGAHSMGKVRRGQV